MITLFMNWILGMGVVGVFCVYLLIFNWCWWRITDERLWADPSAPFSWLAVPILLPGILCLSAGVIVTVAVLIPIAIGSIFI